MAKTNLVAKNDSAKNDPAKNDPAKSSTPRDRATAAAALTRIADFLDVPIAAFYESAPEAGRAPADPARQAEIRELIRQFLRLRDPRARGRCLAYVRRVADEADRSHAPGPAGNSTPGLDGS